jgi:hypothetical protein
VIEIPPRYIPAPDDWHNTSKGVTTPIPEITGVITRQMDFRCTDTVIISVLSVIGMVISSSLVAYGLRGSKAAVSSLP